VESIFRNSLKQKKLILVFINKTFIFPTNRRVLIFQNFLAIVDGFLQTAKDLLFFFFFVFFFSYYAVTVVNNLFDISFGTVICDFKMCKNLYFFLIFC